MVLYRFAVPGNPTFTGVAAELILAHNVLQVDLYRWNRKEVVEAIMAANSNLAGEITWRNVERMAEMEKSADESRTFGERVADFFAASVGSWPFLIVQSVLLAIWMTLNVMAWQYRWDPYPFILLNLVLSFQSAYATPILMSQNRQAKLAIAAINSTCRSTCWPSRRTPRASAPAPALREGGNLPSISDA